VSGGQDSLCLAKLLADLQPKWGWNLAIAHCDHGWQLDAGLAAHVAQFAQSLKLPFHLKNASDLPLSEAAAREWRYKALVEVAQAQGKANVVTGHTKSDRAETVLYNLIRGAGADGFAALTWQRALTPKLQLVRPLLEVTRTETLQFCQEQNLPIWEDAYNQDLKYARNRIRQELLPYLKTHFNPQVETALAQTSELLRADVEYLEQSATELRQQAMTSEDTPFKLNRLVLQKAPLALQRRVIRQFLKAACQSAPNYEQIEAVTALITAPNRTRTSSFGQGTSAEVEGNWIILRQV
ncbi:MAG: tRNA lysidine(34) synthetase TilS, partial [Coleofasciculaceae cyanobacterium]